MGRILSVVALVIIAVYLGIGFFLSGVVMEPSERRSVEKSNQLILEGFGYDQEAIFQQLGSPEEVAFASTIVEDTLRGWYWPGEAASNCGLVMAHGITENRANVLKYAAVLSDCGCSMLMYDHRGHGASDGDYLTGGSRESLDVLAARRFLAEHAAVPANRIGLVGESWGAAAVLLAAARVGAGATLGGVDDPATFAAEGEAPLLFVLADSPYTSWEDAIVQRGAPRYGKAIEVLYPPTFAWIKLRTRADMLDAAPRDQASNIRAPTLLVHSLVDTVTPPQHSRDIAANLKPGVGEARLLDWGAWHAQNSLARPGAYRSMLDSFLRKHDVEVCR